MSSTRVLARSFSPGMAASELVAQLRRQLGGERRPAGDVRQHPLDLGQEIGVGGLAHIVAVEALELGEVEARRRAADLRQVEGRDHLLGGEDFLVAVAPAEPHQVVAHGDGEVAHRPIGIDAERAVALGELGAVRPVDQRNVRHHRHGPAERVVDLLLARGVGEMIVAADDVGDAHVVVVDHDREHVGRRAVRAQQHEVVEVLVLPHHPALHLVLDHGLARERRLEPDHRLDAGRRVGRVAVAPAPVIELGAAFAARLFAHLGELFGAGIAVIGTAGGQQRLGHLAVARRARELVDRVAVPLDAEPGEPVEDGGDRRLGRALAVGVLDPQQHLAAAPAGIEPVEQRGARSADMQEAGGRGGKAGDDGVGHAGGEFAGGD